MPNETIQDQRLQHIVVHKLFKEQNTKEVDAQLSEKLLDSADVSAKSFFMNFCKSLKRCRSILYSAFIDKDPKRLERHIVKVSLEKYLSDISDATFLLMSKTVADRLRQCLIEERMSTGGYLIVFDYLGDRNVHTIAIAMMVNKDSSGINEKDLSFVAGKSLDVDKMALATIVNVDRWLSPDEDESPNYLSFICGLKEASNYYKDDFIGCMRISKNKQATQAVLDCVDGFFREELKSSSVEIERMHNKASNFFHGHREEVVFQNLLNEIMPDSGVQDKLFNYARQKGYAISSSFKPHKTLIKKWEKMVYDGDGIKIEISPNRIKDSTVRYDKETKMLMIKDGDGRLYKEYSVYAEEEVLIANGF